MIILQMQMRLAELVKGRQNRFCTAVTMEQRQTVMHFQREKSRTFLRIGVSTPNLVTKCKGEPTPL